MALRWGSLVAEQMTKKSDIVDNPRKSRMLIWVAFLLSATLRHVFAMVSAVMCESSPFPISNEWRCRHDSDTNYAAQCILQPLPAANNESTSPLAPDPGFPSRKLRTDAREASGDASRAIAFG